MKRIILVLMLSVSLSVQSQTLIKSEIVDTVKVSEWFIQLTKLPVIFIKFKDQKVDFFVNGYKKGLMYCYYWNYVGYQMSDDKENWVVVKKEVFKVRRKRIVRP